MSQQEALACTYISSNCIEHITDAEALDVDEQFKRVVPGSPDQTQGSCILSDWG